MNIPTIKRRYFAILAENAATENITKADSRMEIRYITPSDDRMAISEVYEQSWKFAYDGIIPKEYLDSIPKGRWAASIDNPNLKSLICVENGKIVGTSSFCESRFEQFRDFGEIVSIYFLPDYMGKGYGKILMESVIAKLRAQGYEDIILWVLEENIRARRFYERFGFTLADEYLDDNIGGKNLREVAYVYKMR